MQLQSRSLAVKARRSANFETAPHFGPHHRSDEIYLAIVVAVFWARQHASQASDLRKDEGKPQFSTAFLDGGGVTNTLRITPIVAADQSLCRQASLFSRRVHFLMPLLDLEGRQP